MTTPERDSHHPEQRAAEAAHTDRAVPADAADTLHTTDRTAPSDAAGKPLYAEQDASQAAGVAQTAATAAAAPAQPTEHHTETQRGSTESHAQPQRSYGEVKTVTYSAGTGEVRIVEDERPAQTDGGKDEGSVLDSIKETLLSRTEGLRQRGEQLAHTARLKMEVMQYNRDLESLYARLGRAYHHRSDREILDMIEQEIRQVESDIALRERQLDSQEVSQELRAQRAKAERERLDLNLPEPTVPGISGNFGVEEQPPRITHHLETEKRDTFFGLDKGGVDQQATVAGGNAAFDTQIEPEDSVLTLEELEQADDKRS